MQGGMEAIYDDVPGGEVNGGDSMRVAVGTALLATSGRVVPAG